MKFSKNPSIYPDGNGYWGLRGHIFTILILVIMQIMEVPGKGGIIVYLIFKCHLNLLPFSSVRCNTVASFNYYDITQNW